MAETNPSRVRGLTHRPEYTSANNAGFGRHGWLRLAPAYSVTLANELLANVADTAVVLDPFGGTGTTALSAATRGHKAISCDINPFLLWLAQAKFACYSQADIEDALRCGASIGRAEPDTGLLPAPPMRNIERWWSLDDLQLLRSIRTGIAGAECSQQSRDLLTLAFCRVIIERAKLTRRHQSLSFRSKPATQIGLALGSAPFQNALERILESAGENPRAVASATYCDARYLEKIEPRSIDVVITSPPYPNRMTAIRELRPYMYWLGFLEHPSDAGLLDWVAIGGTWGAATHNLRHWRRPLDAYVPRIIEGAVDRIARVRLDQVRGGKDNPSLLSSYVLRYFSDLWLHVKALRSVVRSGGTAYYVVGNSSFYGELVETDKGVVEMFKTAGFSDVRSRALRKRSSKAELFEFVIEAKG